MRSITCASLALIGCVALTGATALSATAATNDSTTTVTVAAASSAVDGPIDLGTAASYGALGATTVTNTGPTVINGDLGLSPGTSITGFGGAPNGMVNGTVHATDAAAAGAQSDTTIAYNVAASLTPTTTGIGELSGLSLTPGVYTGGALALSDNGALTLAGSANSVWVFQAASTLTIGSATRITITGGASACNVFWQVGSSATIGTAAQFQGTVLAQQSVTATTSATVVGRLLARGGAVTLDTNTITAPTGCSTPGTASRTVGPTITSGPPPAARTGVRYTHSLTSTGSPTPTYTITSGALPAGLALDSTTGTISGTPDAAGESTFTITASNGTAPATGVTYTMTTSPAATPGVPPVGVNPAGVPPVGVPPVGVPPVGAPPVGAPPVSAPPVSAPPVGIPPIEVPPIEETAPAGMAPLAPIPAAAAVGTPTSGKTATPSRLAVTGTDPTTPLAAGSILLVGGAGLTILAVTLRRRAHKLSL